MQIGLGVLGLRPADFWSMTFIEFDAALEGWMEKSGTKRSQPMRRAEYLKLLEVHGTEETKRKLGVIS